MMIFFSITSLLFVFNYLFISSCVAVDFELELLQVLFRHGDRTPEKDEVYKTDPYDPDYYQSVGYGQLTKIGKQREYRMGQMLRKRYDVFLGEFNNDEVFAYSTDFDRTKMSLQLALAGLYPPTQKTSWNDEIYWSPIPAHYNKKGSCYLYIELFGRCSKYGKHVADAEKTPEIQKKMAKYKDFLEYVKNKTEIANIRPFWIFMLYNNLRGVQSMGLPLPSWCSEEDLNNLEEIAGIALEIVTYTEFSKKIMAGLMIEKFIENMKAADKRKIYMHSAHDVSLSAFTRAHNFTDAPKVPNYGSAVMIEKLRGSDGQAYVRMLMWTGDSEEIIPLNLANCSSECLLRDYEKIVKSMILTDEDKKCFNDQIDTSVTADDLYKRYFSDFKYSIKKSSN